MNEIEVKVDNMLDKVDQITDLFIKYLIAKLAEKENAKTI
jgi:glutamine synthetase